ncbi:protein UsfY [Mycolicibacterium fortuitum]
MGDRANDPVDHARTTRKHAGQNWKNTRALPALIAIGMAAATIFTSLYAFATGYPPTGIAAAAISAALLIGGLGWLRRERRRVRRIEIEYVKQHPHADAQIPTS